MRLLLDTHIFLWYVQGSARMPAKSLRLIGSAESIFVSSACIWELAIKARRGHFHADLPKLIEAVASAGFTELPVRFAHAAAVATLPPIHFDPFDRIMVAQSILESLLLVTVDRQLSGYSPLIQVV